MKLVRFSYDNAISWGMADIDTGNIHTDLSATSHFTSFQQVMDYFDAAEISVLPDTLKPSDIKWLAPVLPTKNVLCIGKNYHDHILEFDGSSEDIENIKENPIFFTKAISSIIGPDTAIDLHPEATAQVDYEAELAVIIGKPCLNVSEEDALGHVYGYTCLNDITARDLQRTHQQWARGKSLDTFCPIGPWLVTSDDIGDPQNLKIQSIINDDVRQDANTALMIHSIAAQISTLSTGMTLNPGDIIATGTPKGVGMGFKPPKLLTSGDKVEIWIEGIGRLSNSVR